MVEKIDITIVSSWFSFVKSWFLNGIFLSVKLFFLNLKLKFEIFGFFLNIEIRGFVLPLDTYKLKFYII